MSCLPVQVDGISQRDSELCHLGTQSLSLHPLLTSHFLCSANHSPLLVFFTVNLTVTRVLAPFPNALCGKRSEARRLMKSNTILAQDIQELAGHAELVVAACIHSLAGREDLLYGLLSSPHGRKWQRSAIRGECKVVLALPEVQQFMHGQWVGDTAKAEVQARRLSLEDNPRAAMKILQQWAIENRRRRAEREAFREVVRDTAGMATDMDAVGEGQDTLGEAIMSLTAPGAGPALYSSSADAALLPSKAGEANRPNRVSEADGRVSKADGRVSKADGRVSRASAALETFSTTEIRMRAASTMEKPITSEEPHKRRASHAWATARSELLKPRKPKSHVVFKTVVAQAGELRLAAEKAAYPLEKQASRYLASWINGDASVYEGRKQNLLATLCRVPALPFIMLATAFFPKLQRLASKAHADSRLRYAYIVPFERFWMYEISCVIFSCLLCFAPSPVTRGEPNQFRDWLIVVWAFAHFCAQLAFINTASVRRYLRDKFVCERESNPPIKSALSRCPVQGSSVLRAVGSEHLTELCGAPRDSPHTW